jgi:type II secretory pathway component PulM
MLENAGGILLALVMVLFLFLSYWLVWSLNGRGKEPREAKRKRLRAKQETLKLKNR